MDWKFFNAGLIHILGLEPEKDLTHKEIMGEIKKLEDEAIKQDTDTIQKLMETVRDLQYIVKSKDKLIMSIAEKNQEYHDAIKGYKKTIEIMRK